jgi:hypothetical protein
MKRDILPALKGKKLLQIIFLAQIGNVQKVNYDCRFNSKFG